MKIYDDLQKIAQLNAERDALIEHFSVMVEDEEDFDIDGLDFFAAHFIDGCEERNGHLYRNGNRLDNARSAFAECYCNQRCGYCEDGFYGTLYFKTDAPGTFIAIPFE